MKHVYIRLNGRGNAWPVFVGGNHPFYNASDPDDLGNVSYSIIGSDTNEFTNGKIDWELLIDAGNNTVPYIIRNENRIPEAMIITHPHLDHIVGIDWIAQSYVHLNDYQKKYPLYTTLPCWEIVKNSFHQLINIIDFHELETGVQTRIEEVPEMFVTAYPVFHGESGFGASLLLFEHHSSEQILSRAVITGDMLVPLLRNKDFEVISSAKVMYIDSNNRFSYPVSSHGSFTSLDPLGGKKSEYLTKWLENLNFSMLFAPHLQQPYNSNIHAYFDEFIRENKDLDKMVFSITDMLKRTNIKTVNLVHYSGNEDLKMHHQKIMNDKELEKWSNDVMVKENIQSKIFVPKTGSIFQLA